ncbi:MAG: hypothetical protein IPH20_25715 [Bacteroidales bacterium]|nr:hypothetical protein [Bacteroidales bacterium]
MKKPVMTCQVVGEDLPGCLAKTGEDLPGCPKPGFVFLSLIPGKPCRSDGSLMSGKPGWSFPCQTNPGRDTLHCLPPAFELPPHA